MAKYAKTDRFGRPYIVCGLKTKEADKDDKYPYGYFELSGKLYKLEVSEASEDKTQSHWARITRVEKRKQVQM